MTEPTDSTIASEPGGGYAGPSDRDEAFCSACNQSFPMDTERCPNDGAKLTKLLARPDALIGRVFDGRYEIRTALGEGGMGTVYRGWQISVDREVAIKVIHAKLATDRMVVKRFLREARLSSRLSQPGIVNVYDFGQTDDGILYLVMELIRGRTLSADLEAQQPLPLRRVIAIGSHLCDALEAAHGQGIIHRDLKPGNIMILDDPPGRDLLKVLDFGLSKSLVAEATSLVTHSSALLGTPLYMAPEQIESKPSDQRGDLYSLGCILYQLATGRPPFLGATINKVLASHLGEVAPPLPGPLGEIIARLMEKQPERRIATAGLVRDALQRLGDVQPAALATGAADASEPQRATAGALAMTLPSGAARARRPGWHWLAGGFSLAAVAVVSMVALGRGSKGSGTTHALVSTVHDAGPRSVVVDAMPGAMPDAMPGAMADAMVDAMPAPLTDAAPTHRLALDAASRPHATVVKRLPDAGAPVPLTPTPPVDAAAGAPNLDFAPRPK